MMEEKIYFTIQTCATAVLQNYDLVKIFVRIPQNEVLFLPLTHFMVDILNMCLIYIAVLHF